ncbi:MAG: hypothetical protein MJZ84_06725 [Paludibacteraceae bacterium]|nr:hypothetical protein [Paludibacteraceae bacterium]
MKQTFKFLTLFLLTLLGTSNLWAFSVNTNTDIRVYIDVTNQPTWTSNVALTIGNGTGSNGTASLRMPATHISNTNLWFKKFNTNWGNLWWFAVYSADWGTDQGKGYDDYSQWIDKANLSAMSTQDYNMGSGSMNLITLASGSNHPTATMSYIGGWNAYENLNKTQTVKVMVKAAGGSYTEKAYGSWPATIKAKRYKLSAESTASVTDADLISATFTSVITSTAKIYVPTPSTGYTFKGWGTSSEATPSNASSAYEYTVSDATTIYLFFDEDTYNISATANPIAGGTVTPTTATAMGQISGGNITATPKTSYHFVNWTLGTATGTFGSSTTASTTFKPTKAGTVVANFAENTHNITISNDSYGTTSPTGAQSNVGEVTGISITATPADGYGFKEWVYTGGTISGQSATTTFKPTADNATIQATFQSTAVYYDLTVGVCSSQSATQGTVSSSPAAGTNIQAGTEFTLTATPATGYEVEGWYSDAACTGAQLQNGGNTYSFSLSATMEVYVKFKEKTFSVTVQAGTGIDQVTGGGANVGQLTGTAITATVKSGYTWSTWTGGTGTYVNGATVKDNTFRPTAASTLTATATENKYNVTINTNLPAGASLKFGSTSKTWGSVANVGIDSKQSITVTLNAGYTYDGAFSITGGARVSGSGSSFTVWADGADGTITVNIKEDLSSNWYLAGTDNIFPDGWNTSEKNMMKRAAGHSTENVYYFTIHVDDTDIKPSGQESTYQFKIRHYKEGDGACNDWFGSNDNDHFWIQGTSTMTLHNGGNNNELYFIPTVAGDYEFKVDATDGANVKLTVTWPIYNCVYGDFDIWDKTAHKLDFGDGNEASTVVNITDISKSYEFLVLVNSNYLTNNASFTTPITRSTASEVAFAAKGGSDKNAKFTPDIAGNYTFTYNKSTNKLTITYPTLPTASTTSTEKRMFNENELSFIDSGEGTEANPYKIYTDEALTIDITALAAQTNLTAKYQFGEEAATTDVLTKTITNPSTTETSILVKAFYESDGVAGTAWEKTIYYQGVAKPSLNLTTSWSTHNDEAQEGVDVPENVTIYYSAGNYNGAATVTRSKDGADPVVFMNIGSGDQAQETYTLPDKNVQRQTFVATAEVNGRTFTATKAISIYRLVEITITDAYNLMNHYYMWEDGTNPTREEETWPGKSFFSTLGNAHIFYVKYPSYTHFVLNNGKGADASDKEQTIDVALPDRSTCYTIGEQIVSEDADNGKYAVQEDDECPNKLYVGDIAAVSAVQGEGVIVSPQVDIDPLLDANNLVISFNYLEATGISCDQRGRSFMVTATAGTGTYNISVTYSIPGAESVTKPVTINVTSAIMIQAKYGNLGWSDHNEIYIHYWGTDINATQKMTWKDYVGEDPNKQDRVYARIPLGTDDKINFQIYAWNMDNDKQWHITKDVTEVTASGCYIITPDPGCDNGCKRNINREGDNCWTAYYVEIDMNNGTVYRSNTVEDLSQTVSFFAPGASEETAKAGLVRIICNGTQKAIISASTFDSSTVYTAKITANGEGLTDVAYYTGDYYIRTDGVDGGWSDYKKASHKFTNFSLYNGAKYNYYWVANVKEVNDKTTFNIKGCVGNEYNENLANMIESDNYTDGTGNITVDGYGVNLRFGYNPQTNHFERAILKGAGDNSFLNIQGDNVYNDEACTAQELNETNYNSHPEYSKFSDVSDWVYEKLIFVKIDNQHQSSSVLLKSKAFNNQILYQLGYTTDNFGRSTSTPAQKVVMGAGSTNGNYTLRVIYDYKTNRLSATWEPSGEINEVKKVDSDILFVSNEGGDVKQITFGSDSAKARLESLQSVMYVLELENNDQDKTTTPDAQYWIALPFECKISDIFGIENYITLDENRIAQSGYWGIMRYRGDLRAQKGWFLETNSFWEWMYPTETLMPGEGYVLYVEKKSLSWNSITVEEPCEGTEDGCQDGKKSVQKFVKRFYFPSLVEGFTMNKSTDASSKTIYPNQPCNITSPVNRRAEDSNWKVIAPKSYNNVTIKSADDQDATYLHGPDFIYEYNEHAAKGSRYTATATEGFEFKAFHGYMAQYGGTITWNPYSKTEHPTSAPRFGAANDNFKGGMLTIELVQNDEQLDRTFISLSKNGTTGFDQNLDLTKITENCAQIASVSENVVYAGSTLPLDIELVPLNIKVTANGMYDIALEKSLEGLEVKLYDAFEQTTTLLDQMPATITLNKGEYKDRFYLQLTRKNAGAPTNLDGNIGQYNLPTDKTQKLLINGDIYLINAGRVYNATGAELR